MLSGEIALKNNHYYLLLLSCNIYIDLCIFVFIGLPKQVCGHVEDMPTMVYFVETTLLIIRVRSLGMVKGSGFRIHFTLARRACKLTVIS